jgi:phenylalanyl-tRNA synthetase alpha chain
MSQPPDRLSDIRHYAHEQVSASVPLADIRQAVLGRKGMLTEVLRTLGSLPPEERAVLGQQANDLRQELEELLRGGDQPVAASEKVDITVPPFAPSFGTIHPISAMIERMVRIFQELSFEVVEGPEIVTDHENFEVLNIGKDHPARGTQDTFFLNDSHVLRTQTTAVQVLEMNRRLRRGELPIRVVVPGKVYRREATDATHACTFHQFDAVMVDSQTTFADLKGCLDYFAKRLFGNEVETRFRPHHFPFTEPSAELDIRWKGDRSGGGKQTHWLEMGGCGMIHPDVLKRAGLNPKIYQGWAFGMSVERPIMVGSQLPDIRMLYTNSVPFLSQFTDLP